MSQIASSLLVAAASWFSATQLAASTLAYATPSGTVGNQNFSGPVGYDFQVNSPISISSLGVFDSGGDGLVGTEVAYIWSRTSATTGTLLTSMVFDAGTNDTLDGAFRIADLDSPLILGVGDYTISADGFANIYNTHGLPANFLGVDGAGTTDDGGGLISFTGTSRFQFPPVAGSFPDTVDAGPTFRFAAATFAFDPVPEPTTALFGTIGLVMLGARRRKA